MQFARPRGTRDFAPEEMAKRRNIRALMREVFTIYGYKEISTPTFEHLELITAKAGEEIKANLYHFRDKSGRDLALRPELTAPVMRFYVERMQKMPKPIKLFYFGNCFRYERTQAGRYREFWQAGSELIGPESPEAEAEVIALASDILKRTGLKDFEVAVGNLGILKNVIKEAGLNEDRNTEILRTIDKGVKTDLEGLLDELGVKDTVKTTLLALIETSGDRNSTLKETKEIAEGFPGVSKELGRFKETLISLEHFGIKNYSVNMGIARGLDYYTGMVFEIYAPKLGAEKQICGGGSYSLVDVFGGSPTSTSGFAFGFDRLVLALDKEKITPEDDLAPLIYVLPVSSEYIFRGIEIASRLRKNWPTDVELMRRKIGKALKYVNNQGIRYVLFVGEEIENKKLTLKDMKKGEQWEIPLEGLEGRLEEVL